jgi:uncharacterized phage protein (TIGR02218 family)
MSSIPFEMRDCTTLCHCWRLERRDGKVFGFTDHDRALTVGGLKCEPQSGFTQAEARASLGMAVDAVDIEGALTSDVLSGEDIDAGLFDGASVETLLVDWSDPARAVPIRKAVIGRISRADGRFVAELESVAASLDRPNGRYLRRNCDARLGDARCGVDLSGNVFTGAGEVVALTAPATLLADGLSAFEPGWFAFGEITFETGALGGRVMAVIEHGVAEGDVFLTLPADENSPAPGDRFTVRAGCDKHFATCRAKFSNPENFRGFPHLPGNDAAYAYVTVGMEFDGGVLVE